MNKVSIVIPAHNEERRIGSTLSSYSSYFEHARMSGLIEYEILVVINNTHDRTEQIVKEFARKNTRIRYFVLRPGGKGYAVIEGFKDALIRENDFIGFVDADMATSPEEYFKLVYSLAHLSNCGGVIASRYVEGAVVNPRNTLLRILASRLYNFVIRATLLFPYRDTQCGAKVFRREAISACLHSLGMTKWAFDVELIYRVRKAGFQIYEYPTLWANRAYATINFWQSGPWMSLAVVRLRLLNSPLRFLVRVYDKVINKVYLFMRRKR